VADNNVTPERQLLFGYDGNGNLTAVTDLGGGVTQFTYDSAHRLLTWLDPNQHSSASPVPLTNHYDTSGPVDWQTDFRGQKTQLTYVPPNTVIVDPNGHENIDQYTKGLLTEQIPGLFPSQQVVVTYQYAPATLGIVSETRTDTASNVFETVTMHYDAHG